MICGTRQTRRRRRISGTLDGRAAAASNARVPATLEIRPATDDDLESLRVLYRHLNPHDDAPEPAAAARILKQIGRYDGSAVLIGTCEGVASATCTLIVIPNLTRGGAPYGLIENVVTDPRFRKRGFGKAILDEAGALA